MAGIKIVDLPPLGRDLASTDLLELSLAGGTGSRKITGQEIMNTSKLNIGTTAITSGTVGRVLFEGAGNVVQESANLFWDNANGRLGIGTSSPSAIIHSVGSVTASGAIARGNFFNNTLVAAANNDALVGLDIQPTFTNGAFTGVENIPLRFVSQANSNVVKNILLKNIGTGNGSGVSIGFNNLNANNLSHAFIKSYYVPPSGMAMSFGTGGGSSLTSEGTTALVLNADQTANFTARVIANSGGFQATGVSANLLMSDNGTPVITRNGSTGIQFLKDAYWKTFSIFTNNTENLRVASTGNVLINTTTDAGFRLDVNGTARVSGQVNFGTNVSATTSSAFSLNYITFSALTSNQGISAAFVPNGTPSSYAYSFQFAKSSTANNNSLLFIGGGASAGPAANKHLITTSTDGTATAQPLAFAVATGSWASATALMTLTTTQNVLINTTTDAGFRLDVNGSVRFGTSSYMKFEPIGQPRLIWGETADRMSIQRSSGNQFIFAQGNGTLANFARIGAGDVEFSEGTNYAGTNPSAIVGINSTTKGFLPPRMTQAQRNAIASPAIGLEIYQTDATEGKYIYKSSGWTYIG